jgi:hypothetical protein
VDIALCGLFFPHQGWTSFVVALKLISLARFRGRLVLSKDAGNATQENGKLRGAFEGPLSAFFAFLRLSPIGSSLSCSRPPYRPLKMRFSITSRASHAGLSSLFLNRKREKVVAVKEMFRSLIGIIRYMLFASAFLLCSLVDPELSDILSLQIEETLPVSEL